LTGGAAAEFLFRRRVFRHNSQAIGNRLKKLDL
jgi:hypothetical protein